MVALDDKLFPLVLVRFAGTTSDEEFRKYLDQMTSLIRRGEQNITVIDGSAAVAPPATQRQLQTAWIGDNTEFLKRWSLGTAFVISSTPVRMALTMMLMLRPLPQGHTVSATLPAALIWAAQRLDDAGLGAGAQKVRAHYHLIAPPRTG